MLAILDEAMIQKYSFSTLSIDRLTLFFNEILKDMYRKARVEINLKHLLHNFREVKKLCDPHMKQIPVVKANAYGHGAAEVALTLEKEGVFAFAVASPEEALVLRRASVQSPILSLGGPFGASCDFLLTHKIRPLIVSLSSLDDLAIPPTEGILPIHLKIDSGMGRLGILPSEIDRFCEKLKVMPHLYLESVLSHFASADLQEATQTQKQIQTFSQAVDQVKVHFPDLQILHLANSAAILSGLADLYNGARPGIMLYGSYPHESFKNKATLKPVMHFKTEMIAIKEVPAGTPVSYAGTFVTERPSRLAVLALGYADGYSRAFSNCGQVLIKGHLCPVRGRVCMDHTIVDITDYPEIELSDEVLLWGDILTADDCAQKIGTISYELFCAVQQRVPREYVS